MASVRISSGASAQLLRLSYKMEALAGKRFRARLHKAMAHEALSLVHDGFDKGVDPYGRPWAPLKYREGQPLRLTRRLESSFRISSSAEGFSLDTNVIYAGVHQQGGNIRHPARVQPRNLRGNRFASFKVAGKKPKASHLRLGVAATRVSFISGHTVHIPARPFFPTKFNLGVRWRKALFDVAEDARRQLMGR